MGNSIRAEYVRSLVATPTHQDTEGEVVKRPDAFLAAAEPGVEGLVHRRCEDLRRVLNI